MRLGLVAQWLRAAIEDASSRGTALRFAIGITVAQAASVLRLLYDAGLLSDATLLFLFVGLVVFELGVPLWAERKRRSNWHSHHIAERYGLFAIILLERACSSRRPAWIEHSPPAA